MKKLGLFLVVCLLLGLFGTQPAVAQEIKFGYVPLLSEDYDISIPREVTSRQSFNQLLPRLMEARASGLIADFEPDFYGGYVKVANPTAQLRGSGSLFPVFSTREEAVVRPPVSAAKIGNRSAGPSIFMGLYSSCFDMYTGIPNAHIKGTLKSPAGEVLGVVNTYADADGDLWDYWDGYSDSNVPGYKVTFKIFNSSEVLVGTYSVTIPRIEYKSIDKAAGKVTGTATAGKDFRAYLFHPNLNSAEDSYLEYIDGTVSATKNWSADFAKAFRGGDQLGIYLYQTSNFTFYRGMNVARVGCRLQSNYCFNNTLPNKSVTLTVTHGGTTYKFTGKTDTSGYLYGYLYNSSGDPVLITAGDKITGTDATTENMPKLTLTANRSANTVSGTAPANKWFGVAIYIWDPWASDYDWVKSTSTGAFTASFSTDIPSKGTIEPDIWYTNPTTGNYWYYYKMIP
jgi:hypothetical protein